MVENEPCALPLSVESPPPYTDPPIPHYTECHLPPPPYMEPSMPIHHDRAALVVQRIYNTSVTMVQLLLKPLSKLDSQLVVQLLAHAEAIFAVLILTLSLIITQTTETYFCTYQLCDGYYGLFIGVFNLLLMSGFALIAVCFPWFKNSPLLFCQTGRCKLLTRIYLTLLCISNIFCGHLILLSSTYEITITRICLITVAVFKSKLFKLFFICLYNYNFYCFSYIQHCINDNNIV